MKGRVDGEVEPCEVYVWLGEGRGLGEEGRVEDVGPWITVLFSLIYRIQEYHLCFAVLR